MRPMFLAFMLAAVAALGVFSSSAFNYAALQPRTVATTIVTDANGYLAVASYDTEYACYVGLTNGKIDLTWDGGTSCTSGATGTGVNPNSQYYFHDVLKITNKGTKTLTKLWLNTTANSAFTLNVNSAAGAMTTSDTNITGVTGIYTTNVAIATAAGNLAPGDSWYIGFKIDTRSLDTSSSSQSATLTIEARSTA